MANRYVLAEAAWRRAALRLQGKFGGAGWSLADQALVSAANFLSILILARAMPAAQFGVFMLAHTGLQLMTSLQGALVTQPHNVLGARREGADYARFTTGLALVQLALSLALGALIALAGTLAWRLQSPDTAAVLFALAAAALPWMTQDFVRRVLYTRSDCRSAAANDLLSYGLQLVGIVALASRGGAPGPEQALLVFGGAALLATGLGVWQLRGHIAFAARGMFGEAWREAWGFGKWLLAQQGMSWFGGSGHGWILAALVGPEKFGMYRAAYQVVNILNPLRQATMNYLPPRASAILGRAGVSGLDRWVGRTTAVLIAPFALCALAIALLAEPLLAAAYGDKYAGMGLHWVVILGACAYLINFARTPRDYGVLVLGGTKALFLRTVLATALVLTLGVALMARYGIYGALASELAIAVLLLVLTQRIYAERREAAGAGVRDRDLAVAAPALSQEALRP